MNLHFHWPHAVWSIRFPNWFPVKRCPCNGAGSSYGHLTNPPPHLLGMDPAKKRSIYSDQISAFERGFSSTVSQFGLGGEREVLTLCHRDFFRAGCVERRAADWEHPIDDRYWIACCPHGTGQTDRDWGWPMRLSSCYKFPWISNFRYTFWYTHTDTLTLCYTLTHRS